MKKHILLPVLLFLGSWSYGQKYLTRTGQVTFSASTPLENIDAVNNEGAGILDAATGDVVFETLIKSFKFEKALMQEHFNENYLESDRYPKASFKGKITDEEKISFARDGHYAAHISGKLTIHGVTKDLASEAVFKVKDDGVTVEATFKIRPADFNIRIPALVSDKIAREVKVTVTAPMHKI